jgi:UDP-glucose 4-epimerase
MGTTNVLDFAKKKAASVTILSSYIYGEPQYLPVDEKHPVGPYNPYCQTKIISEDIALFYHEKFGVDCTIFRPFNIYGSNQNKSFLIPTIVDQVLDKASSEINLMSLNPKRDYIHVLDVVDALMLSTELKGFSTYNLGSGASYSVKEIVNLTQQIAGTNKAILSSGTERKNEVMDVRADISKIEKELNWQPKISIQEGLKLLVQDSKFSL